MAKPSLLKTMARPEGKSTGSTAERMDVLSKAMEEAQPSNESAPKKVQRSREGMVKVSAYMARQARNNLKAHCLSHDEGLEEFILEAINARLREQGADWQVG